MSIDSTELLHEYLREDFKRTVANKRAALDEALSHADAPEEREKLVEQYRADLDKELAAHIHFSIWQPAYAAAGTALLLAAFWLLSKLPIAWGRLPQLLALPGAPTVVAAMTAGLGWCFFELRKRRRGIYATLELAVACATAYKSAVASSVSSQPDRWGYVLGLLASIYIAVRAFDNFDKWLHPEQATLARIVAEAVSAARVDIVAPAADASAAGG